LPVESYLETGQRGDFEGQPTLNLYPYFADKTNGVPCAPIRRQGAEVEIARNMIRPYHFNFDVAGSQKASISNNAV
jgi:hypothetical protein